MDKIHENIKKYRTLKQLTLEELANRIGTTKQTINKYEKGIIKNIPYEQVCRLAEVFDITPGKLMGWNNSNNNDNDVQKNGLDGEYYTDKETEELIQFIHDNSKYRPLFDMVKNVKPEKVDDVIQILGLLNKE